MFDYQKSAIFLVTFAISCNAFWWGSQQSEPAVKQYPLGYFRTYTYHPLTFQNPSVNPYQAYQLSSRVLTNQVPPASYFQKSQISPQPVNGGVFHVQPQPLSSPPFIPPSAQPSQQPPVPPSAPPPSPSSSLAVNQQSSLNDFNGPPSSQFFPHQHPVPLRPNPDPYGVQYMPPAVNVPQVQFVPCMCPVTVSIATEIPADKRSDEYTPIENSVETTTDPK